MSVRSTDPNAILLLQSANKLNCAKRFIYKDKKIGVRAYDDELLWNAYPVEVNSLDDLASTVEKVAKRTDLIAVVGGLIDEEARSRIVRRLHGEDATLQPVERQWMAIDIDKVEVPGESIPERIEKVWSTLLPEPLRSVSCLWQLTSSYGVGASYDKMRMRMWFWLDAPVSTPVLREWAKEQEILDPSVYVTTQPIYVANPRFSGMKDPVVCRIGRLKGRRMNVCVADMCLNQYKNRALANAHAGVTVARADVQPCEAQIESRIADIYAQKTNDSRHMHANGAVCELYALGCDVERIHEVVQDIFIRNGRDPRPGEILELIQYAARKSKAGTLQTNHTPLSQILTDEWGENADDDSDLDDDVLDDIADYALTSKNPDGLNAANYLKAKHPDGGFIRWAEQDWEWVGNRWRLLENKEILKNRIDQMGGSLLSERKAKACAAKVRGLSSKERLTLPGWISKDAAAQSTAIVLQNGMVFVEDAMLDLKSALVPHDTDYFSTHCLPFDFDPDADCPRWKRCLDEWFLDDTETKRELQKMFGYLLTPDNQYEKFFVLTDPVGRAGKGVVVSVLEWLLGDDAVGATNFSGLGSSFGLGSLLGKSVALLPEANAENTRDIPALAIDRIKAITGNDRVSIEKKNIQELYSKMPLRFVLSCNRMPGFHDPSGALMKRMHLLEFRQTFYGREDGTLKQRSGPLFRELAGILNWAIEGLTMLYVEDKGFIRPASTKEKFDQFARTVAPIKAFVDDCLSTGPITEVSLPKDRVYDCYRAWAVQVMGLQRPRTRDRFYQEVTNYLPHKIEHRGVDEAGRRTRVWHGITFTEEGRELVEDNVLA